jgi:hypothetical protein
LTTVCADEWISASCQLIFNSDILPIATPPEDTSNSEPIDAQLPDHTGTPNPTKTNACRNIVVVDNVGGNMYAKATGLYNKH